MRQILFVVSKTTFLFENYLRNLLAKKNKNFENGFHITKKVKIVLTSCTYLRFVKGIFLLLFLMLSR